MLATWGQSKGIYPDIGSLLSILAFQLSSGEFLHINCSLVNLDRYSISLAVAKIEIQLEILKKFQNYAYFLHRWLYISIVIHELP